jgi:hypothetical protein
VSPSPDSGTGAYTLWSPDFRHMCTRDMDVPALDSALEAVVQLRRDLHGELLELWEKRPGLGNIVGGYTNKDIKMKQRMHQLVVATQEQLAIQRWGPPSSGGQGPGASTQVRGSAKLQIINRSFWFKWVGVRAVTAHAGASPHPLKRSFPAPPDVKPQPQLLITTDLPHAIWDEQLLPLLTCKDAARLGCTCKVFKMRVRWHFRGSLGTINVDQLKAALTTFPRARRVTLTSANDDWDIEGNASLVQWLREKGRGRQLAIVTSQSEAGYDLTYKALREGALPSLKGADIDLGDEEARALLTEGFFNALHELCVIADCSGSLQLAALGLLRQLPALTKLELISSFAEGADVEPLQWPPCIPLSLKALAIDNSVAGLMLRALPGMLEASGARLERLEVKIPSSFESIGDGLVHLAQALRCCSPTLKGFHLSTGTSKALRVDGDRMKQWADVLAGVSACRELQVLVLPRIEVEPLFPPGTAFGRLTHLEMVYYKRQHPPGAGVMGLWKLMASGGLPALAKLKVRFEGLWVGAEDVRTRVAPALEAVAGTLTHLHLENFQEQLEWSGDELEVGYELGVAVGKLRRLMDLALVVFRDGRAYHAMAQGLAASGGDRPVPLLARVMIFNRNHANADLVASLLLPSVRVFGVECSQQREAVLLASALRQAGYKHTIILDDSTGSLEGIVPAAIAPSCTILYADLDRPSSYWEEVWGH